MALYEIQHLNFTYPLHTYPTLKDINLSIEKGDFVLLFGPSGSGKSTLLRHLKEEVRPVGTSSGAVHFNTDTHIGMVFQNPEQQIVLSTVYEELAFGMENLGFDPKEMQRRIGELSTFLGINHWLHKPTSELSGGQKQLLNLASVMTLYPEVLLLDEPTAQLDPIAKQNFLNVLKQLNEAFSITIIMTEHDLESVLPLAHTVHFIEDGAIHYSGTSREVLLALYTKHTPSLLHYIPPISKLYLDTTPHPVADEIPLIPKEAKRWFDHLSLLPIPTHLTATNHTLAPNRKDSLLRCQSLYFQYTKTSPLVLEAINLDIPRATFLAIVGGNGSGKSTFLKILAGILTPLKGTLKTSATLGYLPQNPMALFHETTVAKQLETILPVSPSPDATQHLEYLIDFLDLRPILHHHPYDLSGGQMQKVALATILLTKPTLLLLDEPTKGLDPYFKQDLATLLLALIKNGTTIVMVSHDLEFVAHYTDYTTLMFSGQLLSLAPTSTFFQDNMFYTTTISRTVKNRLPHATTLKEVMPYVAPHQS